MTERYSFGLTTFSPSGKLVQIEYALNAVAAGASCVGIIAKDGVVLAVENKVSPTVAPGSVSKIEEVSDHIGMTYSGLGPDFRVLTDHARKQAQSYQINFGEMPSTKLLVESVANVMQEYTQSGGVRPFGVSLLIGGWDVQEDRPRLFQCDPSGAYFSWKATALGRNYIHARTFLERRYNEDLELDDAVHTALLTLKESFDVQITEDNVQIALCKKSGFLKLQQQAVKDYISGM